MRVPFYERPTPARIAAGTSTAAPLSTIAELNDRIIRLEAMLASQNQAGASNMSFEATTSPSVQASSGPSSHSTPESRPLPSPRSSSPGSHAISAGALPEDIRVAASMLAQSAVAHEGEYLGDGTLACTIHKLGFHENTRLKYSRSTHPTSMRELSNSLRTDMTAAVRNIAKGLPNKRQIMAHIDLFFHCRNWSYGVPERWFRSAFEQMWEAISHPCLCALNLTCAACSQDVNPHFLSLVFAILSLSPSNLNPSNTIHFSRSVAARRIAEDSLLEQRALGMRNITDGTVLSCVATAILAGHLADRGCVSDAWKLVGGALRNAQAAGMHRDPGWEKWAAMDKEERELRLGGWWALVAADRLYSFVLGRPPMLQKGTYDVQLPSITEPDGSLSKYGVFQSQMVLLTDVIAEACNKCLNIKLSNYATVVEVDRLFQDWERQLPATYHWRSAAPEPADCDLVYQRTLIGNWYLAARMSLHLPFAVARTGEAAQLKAVTASRTAAGDLSRELVQSLTDSYDEAKGLGKLQLGWMSFNKTYLLFDGAAVLATSIRRGGGAAELRGAHTLVHRAIDVLKETVQSHFGDVELARKGVLVLHMLMDQQRSPTLSTPFTNTSMLNQSMVEHNARNEIDKPEQQPTIPSVLDEFAVQTRQRQAPTFAPVYGVAPPAYTTSPPPPTIPASSITTPSFEMWSAFDLLQNVDNDPWGSLNAL